MTTLRTSALAAAILIATGLCAPLASAQSTDGYHSIQVFPVVVDSASFTQRFTFRNPDTTKALSISASFFPGTGISPATRTDCPAFSVAADSDRVFTSLRDICPGLPLNVYGYLYTAEATADNLPYAGYSRISNPQGNGFSVEAFSAQTFTSADATVTGLRRLTATVGSPAFQTNCFIGNLNDVTPPTTPVNTQVFYTLYTNTGARVGSTTVVNLTPGTLTRLSDVFGTAGVVTGDYDNVRAEFEEVGTGEPGLMTFCTVQDNTSFGADFRIGKQEEGFSTNYSSIGAQDDEVSRDSVVSEDVLFSGLVTPRQFDLPGGAFSNTHVIYFRHPDRIQCELVDPLTKARLTADDAMEMRVLDSNGNLVAGGDGVIGFGEVYLGDKTDRNSGANGRYTIEVEGTGTGLRTNTQRAYGIHCQSGSGHTVADMVRYHDAVTRF